MIVTIHYKSNPVPVSKTMSAESAKKMFTDIYNACNSGNEFIVFTGKNGPNLFIRVSEIVECNITDEPNHNF